jgi:NAD(P)-dependent dehydrogenase (short-subunit alcohol dehydrogenase family)
MTTNPMNLQGAVAVVTGAQSGLGPHFVSELLRRGAEKVYAMSRAPEETADPRVRTAHLDVTDPDSITAAARRAGDATFVVNNDVLVTRARLIDGDLRDIDLEMETNFYGALGVTRAFAPILIAHGGGTILNVHAPPRDPAPAEAAACAMTEVIRAELAAHRVRVAGLHVVSAEGDAGRLAGVVAQALDDLAAGTVDIVADPARVAA